MPPTEDLKEPGAPPRPPALYRIAAPGPVTGGVMGVAFANGHAVVDDDIQHARALAWFRAEPGYRVEALDQPTPQADTPPEPAPAPVPDDAESTDDDPPAATARRRK